MDRLMLRRVCAGLSAIVMIALAIPALAAEKETEHFGDTGGTPFSSSCNGGAVVGFSYYWDTYNLSGITAVCRNIDEKGLPTGPTTSAKSAGVTTKYTGNIACSSGYLNRIGVALTNAQTVQFIEPQCFDVTRGPSQTEDRKTSYNGIAGKTSDAFCGSYETYAYAIVGTFSKDGGTPGINSIGLKCRTLDTADNKDDDDGGDQAVAPDGTTIYKQPNGDESEDNIAGFVDPGGTVTVVKCSGNFCQVSAPEEGYVWHADIGR